MLLVEPFFKSSLRSSLSKIKTTMSTAQQKCRKTILPTRNRSAFSDNQRLQLEIKRQNELLDKRPSSIEGAGFGLFAKQNIEPGTELGYYRGRKFFTFPKTNSRNYTYMMQLSRRPSWISKKQWTEKGHPVFIDATKCLLAFMNCCKDDPSKQNVDFSQSGMFKTTKTILQGQELLCYYGQDYWER